MKKLSLYLILLTPMLGFGQVQNKKIQALWTTIQQQEQDAEIKSMLPNITEVKSLSKKYKDYPSLIKAMFFEAKISILTKEDKEYDINTVLNEFDAESKKATGVQKAVLDTYIAILYDLYYQANAYKIRNRTDLAETAVKGIEYWTAKDFKSHIDAYYQKALASAEAAKGKSVAGWSDVFVTEDQTGIDWNTLSVYDFIQLEYLNYLSKDRNNAEEYNTQILALETSVLNDLKANKQTSLYLYIKLRLLQNSGKNAEELLQAFTGLKSEYPNEPIVYDALANYVSGKELVALADEVQSLFPNTATAIRFAKLKKDTEASRMTFRLKKYVLDDVSIPLYVNHSNKAKVYVQVLRVEEDTKLLNSSTVKGVEGYQALAKKYNTVSEYSLDLKTFDDYKSHQTIVALEPLKSGRYYVVLSDTPFDVVQDKEVNIQFFDLNVTSNLIVENDTKLKAYNAKTGKPLVNTDILVSNGPVRSNANTYWETSVKTDGNGEYNFDFVNKSGLYFFNVKGEDVYFSKHIYPQQNTADQSVDEKAKYSGVVMTDRSIYRPGQVVYFKTIVSKKEQVKEQVAANQTVDAILYDANYDEVAKLTLTTNEFGSANGQFVLPTSGLLGRFSLEIERDEQTIVSFYLNVEEYKRPKFQVALNKPTDIYTLGDTVAVKGSAKAYMGGNIDQAKVVYRVERNEEWPYWIWRDRGSYRYEEPVVMTQGEMLTDEEGNFEVLFTALPAEEKNSTNSPRTYNYTVFVDVIDTNGETHTATERVLVGDKNIELTVALPYVVTSKELAKFAVDTKNLNGVSYPAKGEVAIYAIDKPFAPRLLDGVNFGATDYELYDYETFTKALPYTEYANELDERTWKEGKQVFTAAFDTDKTKEIKFEGANQLPSGSYLVKGMVFENGEKTEYEQNITLVNKQVPAVLTKVIEVEVEDKAYNSGEKAKVRLRAAEENTNVLVEVFANGKRVQQKTVVVGAKGVVVDVPIKREYTAVAVHVVSVKNGIAEVVNEAIKLSNHQDELKITLESFRDKIEPGAKEKWSLKITGENTDKMAAEVLATMYDSSLDQFSPNNLNRELKEPIYYRYQDRFSNYSFSSLREVSYPHSIASIPYTGQALRFYKPIQLNVFGFGFNGGVRVRGMSSMLRGDANAVQIQHKSAYGAAPAPTVTEESADSINEVLVTTEYSTTSKQEQSTFAPRKNLKETAFFYPTLRTDEKGNVKVEFTMPEALTQWKFQAFAHTKDLRQAKVEQLVQTQKEIMVVPNLPRFLREGDQLTVSSKVINVADKDRNGTATLTLLNAYTQEVLEEKEVQFTLSSAGSTTVDWQVVVPKGVEAISCRIVASDGTYSDGEETVLAVLSNQMLVTETMPIAIKEGQNKLFIFDEYETKRSEVKENHKLIFELTSNPIWNAIFALPSLQESSATSTDQLYSKVFANAVATQILHANPEIKVVFDQWSAKGELVSKLEQNAELKSILLSETPWVRDAETETERMKRLAILFDLNKMRSELVQAMTQLELQQNTDGGFPWYAGGLSDQYITQSIIEGFGELQKMGVLDSDWMNDLDIDYNTSIKNAINYLDATQYAKYSAKKALSNTTEESTLDMHYLYVRSLFMNEIGIKEEYAPMIASMRKGIEATKSEGNLYQQAMRAIVAKRFGLSKIAEHTLKSIMEASVASEVNGVYWKDNKAGWLWYQSPVEIQAMMLEAANEIDAEKYVNEIEEMKVWLLKNKQTNAWSSTKSTTRAIYALLNTGKSWSNTVGGIEVKVGGYPLNITQDTQMGSGYTKQIWTKDEMLPKQGIVELTKSSPGISYGAMYWQYFEDLNEIVRADGGIQLTKELFIKSNTDKGQVLHPITEANQIKVGDIVTVRLTIQVDQDMDYVHIKDMRASGFEPIHVLSGYKWRNEFNYYEETRDAATNFFINRLPQGKYVFEYDLRANVAGVFSNGVTTLQNMYAPEMNAHSQGTSVQIKK